MNATIALPYPSFDPRRARRALFVLVIMAMVSAGLAQAGSLLGARSGAPVVGSAAATAKAAQALSSMPISFITNEGQLQNEIAFMVLGSETSLGFLHRGVAYRLTDGNDAYVVRQSFVGGRASTPVGVEPQAGRYSWFKGPPDEWVSGASAYSALRYRNVWPGIDVVYSGDASQVKYRFVVSPGADPNSIRMAYRGAGTTLTASGDLIVATPVATFTDAAPRTYQGDAAVPSSYALRADGTYSFVVGAYDTSKPLVIDPAVIVYSGFIGGSGDEEGLDIALDTSGAAYVTGRTSSDATTFPTSVGPDATSNGGTDAFVAKVDPSGASLDYVGYIGGVYNDEGQGIAVDTSGAAYIVGATKSGEATFPVIGGPDLTLNSTQDGPNDAFVAKIVPSGTSLSYAGYIGGADVDAATGIAIDSSGAAYVTGYTDSGAATFPVAGGPDLSFAGTPGSYLYDAFVAKVAPSGASLTYAGYIGGIALDASSDIALNEAGAAYITGRTNSSQSSFPVSGGPDLTFNGGYDDGDAFVAKVDPTGSSLAYAGYVGGVGDDRGNGIAVDSLGAAYITGETNSNQTSFPVAGGPDLTYNGGNIGAYVYDAFVAKVAPSGASLSYAGYIGGTGSEAGWGVAVDTSGAAYVAGRTDSKETSFPVRGGPDLTLNGFGDAFVAKVDPTGRSLTYSGYVGGYGYDYASSIAIEPSGAAYITGQTGANETTFPVVGGPDLTSNGGNYDAFVVKVSAFTSLSIKAPSKVPAGSKAKITGVLSSGGAACATAQQVTLKKGAATVGTVNTSATGSYKFTLKIKRKTTVQVTYAGSSTCGYSASSKKTIKVT